MGVKLKGQARQDESKVEYILLVLFYPSNYNWALSQSESHVTMPTSLNYMYKYPLFLSINKVKFVKILEVSLLLLTRFWRLGKLFLFTGKHQDLPRFGLLPHTYRRI